MQPIHSTAVSCRAYAVTVREGRKMLIPVKRYMRERDGCWVEHDDKDAPVDDWTPVRFLSSETTS